ncbi:hypothetical protein GGTG_07622 [Gaeumannomyces tritici R3-111a-1]|uniref:Cupin type-1 domain-containing protein n=1 Tax=Gaeumannomyces tritici (strain R3-111a-1) TaxID=644352 RepID=J3P274_GAET3|nr:hypothetical protein GGTG_07622 [Gaeumannomyces tritici R3-111a-1]EJT73766.1 hypothetical protein GGTG_07622 [Gaeumannomyces tritici R3-111a-1]
MKLLGLGVLGVALAAPAPQMPANYGQNQGPVGGITPPLPTVSEPRGQLRGDLSLQGGIAPRPKVHGGDSAVVPDVQKVAGQDADPKLGVFLDFNSVEKPEPFRGERGATDPGPRTYEYERLNPDLFAPPTSDKGDVLPVAKKMAGVDMRLSPWAYRELHWHTSAEWALVLKGSVRVAAMNEDGESFLDDVTAGDVWYFPPGIPHSLQALGEGTEFLLVFDDGAFSEDETFLATETFMRNPESVLAKNFEGLDLTALRNIPREELFIFNGSPADEDISKDNITGSAGAIKSPNAYTYHWSQQKPFETPGGSVKILDPITFPVAPMFSAALVTVQPGAMRELHWHTTSDEWNFFLQGSARMTVFKAPSSSRTFDYTAGNVGYIEAAECHYIENTGTEDVIFLEVLQAPKFSDISVSQWLALTPCQVVKDTLSFLPDAILDKLPKDKTLIKVGNKNMTAIADGGKS